MKENFKIESNKFICDGKYYFDEQEERFSFIRCHQMTLG